MIDLGARLLFWGVLFLSAARVGAWITRSELRGLAHLAWDGLSGMPLLIAAWLAVGLLAFNRISALFVVLVFVAVALWRSRADRIDRFGRLEWPRSRAVVALVLLLAGVAVTGLLWNRVPVLFYDSLAYHHAQPETWIIEGRIAPYEWSLHSWFPPGMSVLYGAGLLFGGEPWANDANLLLGLALLLIGFDLGRRLWGDTAGWIVSAALLAVPQVMYALAVPAADLAHATFVAATVGALFLAPAGDGSWSRRASWLTAGALLTKYLAILVPLVTGALFCALAARRSTPVTSRLRAAVIFCLPAFALLLPWMVADTAVTGNPVAPILSSWVETEGLAEGGAESFSRDARGGLPTLVDIRALGPRLFAGEQHGIYPSPAWGWAVAVWIVVAAVGSFVDTKVRRALLVAGLLFVVWFLTYRWERFLIPVVFFLCVALAGTLWWVAGRSRAGRLAAIALLLAGIAMTPKTLIAIERYSGARDLFFGRESRQEFLERSWPQQRLIRSDGVVWRKSDRLLLVGEMRHYRIPVRRSAPTGFNVHPFAVEFGRAQAAEQLNEALRRRGFTHLLVDLDWVERGIEQYPGLRELERDPEKLASYIQSLGPPLAFEGRRALFAIPEQR